MLSRDEPLRRIRRSGSFEALLEEGLSWRAAVRADHLKGASNTFEVVSQFDIRCRCNSRAGVLDYEVSGRSRSHYHAASRLMPISSDRNVVRENISQCSWPRLYYGVLQVLAGTIDARAIAEIGVAYGYHAENLLSTLKNISYFGIDPYLAGYDPNDTFVRDVCHLLNETDPQRAMDRLYDVVKINLLDYGDRAKLYRKTSIEAVSSFSESFFDLIFVDGDHTYNAVKADLAAWWAKLKTGGIICGDDYHWPGVKRAVDEFALTKGQILKFAVKPNTNYQIWVIDKSSCDAATFEA